MVKILYYYIDFLAKSFDIKSKSSRKSFWISVLLNTMLMLLLVSVGLSIPEGRPLQIYIALSSIVSTPLIPPFITLIIRRLNDVRRSRLFALLMLCPMGLGMPVLLYFCAGKSAYGTVDDFSQYQSFDKAVSAVSGFTKSIFTVYPFIYLVYILGKLFLHSGITGINIALLSLNLLTCALTVIGIFKPGIQTALPYIGILKKLTVLSNAMLTIILYQDTQSLIEASVMVYLYFYVMLCPIMIATDIAKLFRERKLK